MMPSHSQYYTRSRRLLAAALVFGVMSAQAGTITLTNIFSLDSGFTSSEAISETNSALVYIDPFDTSLGILTGVQVVVDSTISGTSFVSALSADSASPGASMMNSSNHYFTVFDQTTRVKRELVGYANCMLGDGSASDDRCFNILSLGTEEFTDTMTFGPGDLDDFSTGDSWAVTFRTELVASWIAAPNDGSIGATRSFAGNITVVYDYEPTAQPVPSPASLVLMLPGLAIMVGARINRRRQAKKWD